MPTPQLDIAEEFARFFESPSREKLRELLRKRTGEYDFFDFKEALEALLKREVDLVSGHSIHNPFFQDELNKTKETLYAA